MPHLLKHTYLAFSTAEDLDRRFSSAVESLFLNSVSLSSASRASLVYASSICVERNLFSQGTHSKNINPYLANIFCPEMLFAYHI